MPFGLREINDISFELEPLYESRGIRFINQAATQLDPEQQTITTTGGEQLDYDRLMLATGPRLAFEKVPGLGPEAGYTQSACTSEHALLAREAWQRFLKSPGPAIVGTAQGGSCFGASYEFLLNLHHQIKKAGLQDQAPVTFITAEPFIGHLGLGGVANSQQRIERYLDKLGIEGIPNSSIKQVRDGELELHNGRVLPFAYSMIVPPFTGVDLIRQAPGLANAMEFIPITDEYNHPEHPEIYAAGVDIAIAPPGQTPVPAGVPKTGQMSETMAKVAAQNIASDIQGGKRKSLPLEQLSAMCILDGGNNGIIFKADDVLGKDGHSRVISGPQAHWAKLAFERYFLTTRKHGVIAG